MLPADETAGGSPTAHAVQLAAAGLCVLGALPPLADVGVLVPAEIRWLLPHVTGRSPGQAPTEQMSLPRRLLVRWADDPLDGPA
ncbi:hypothetical protein [Streptomyces sp. NPDC051132]|uniref:hypothetical protein n=1 Tax=unclassified Streptomyces TaxID=2593676 RepID=UPI0034358FBA